MSDGEIATLFENGFHTELDVAGEKTRKLVRNDSLDVSQFTVSQAGAVAYVAESSAVLPELFVEGKVVSRFNDGFHDVGVQKGEIYTYKSFDGIPIEAALFRGLGLVPGQLHPVMVLIHGGPAGAWRNRFDGLTQLLVAHGYTVMQPNIRGSMGYGQKFLASNRGDWGGGDYKDVMAGVDGPGEARYRGSHAVGHRGLVVRRLHGGMGHHPDGSLPFRDFWGRHGGPGHRVRDRSPVGRRRMVLRGAL
jgi:dipeptidyl aminopeptidase/acylaminoacyl peptidase